MLSSEAFRSGDSLSGEAHHFTLPRKVRSAIAFATATLLLVLVLDIFNIHRDPNLPIAVEAVRNDLGRCAREQNFSQLR